ncbi:hypothetical protein [Campylobacter mucosalis]|uniref:Pyridoxamine 5'-phosphate oxidase putative domain-containing protein n=1 Tax=Campylobacter mucosalis CCUG 21559 TaxID=1032067 RepID=A0A6G5QI15_9BACT|nr:hypothetical protein [Campylobacter mucosalis]QCD45249.1 putative protein pyridoxine 5'-phosphate oxidase family protein [Campylobacter mucosalis CCUG 21559]
MIDSKILKFLSKQHLASLCVLDSSLQMCPFSAFYAFDKESISLVIASDSSTKHIKALEFEHKICGTIAINTLVVAKIEGVQFHADIITANSDMADIYFKRFAYAKAMHPTLWQIRLNSIKYTSNTLGFANKISWQREQ